MNLDALPEAIPGAIITFPILGDAFSLAPNATYTLFGHTFYWYGAIIGLGFLLAVLYGMYMGPRYFGISADTIIDAILIGLPTGLIGARLYYVFCHFQNYVGPTLGATLWNWCKIWEGGTAIPGGLLLASVCILLYTKKKKISFGALADTIVLGLLIAQVIGRWSNFMNREYIGAITDIFCRMGLTKDGMTIYVHPLFLYESLWNLVGFVALSIWCVKGKRRYDGQAALLYVFWYGLIRLLLEGIRTSPLLIPGTTLRASQVLMGSCCLIALVALILIGRKPHDPADLMVNRVRAAAADTQTDTSEEETDK